MKSHDYYVMNVTEESSRLERQASIPAYDVNQEFGDLRVPSGARVLDAGCGTGVVTRYLGSKFQHAKLEGCDLSSERLEAAREQSDSSIQYFLSDLTSIQADGDSFDIVVSRYVFEHVLDPSAVMREIFRVIRPGGALRVVDLDGLIVNMHPISSELSELLNEALSRLPVDLCVGRRLPEMMGNAGFEDIDWRVEVHGFRGQQLEAEKQNIAERLSGARKGLQVALNSELRAKQLEKLILEELENPHLVLFYNKFIVDGRKPEA